MENKTQDPGSISDDGVVKAPNSGLGMDFRQSVNPSMLLSESSMALGQPPQPVSVSTKQPNILVRLVKRADVILAILLLLSMIGVLIVTSTKEKQAFRTNSVNAEYETQDIPLEDFIASTGGVNFGSSSVVINGSTELTGGLVITPSLQPSAPKAGQIYFDEDNDQLAYYNGVQFVVLGSGVESVGNLSGQVTLGGGLAAVGNQLVNAGVLSLGGQGGAIVLGGGLDMAGNTLQNTGVLNVIAGSDIAVANDGNGNFTVSNVGAGTGTVTSGGGTVGRIPLFTGTQNIENSIVSQSGLTVTISGDLSVVTGGLSLSNALTVSNGGTGAASLSANGVIVGNGTSALTSVAAGGAGLCLLSTAGAPAWGACPGGSGVSSLNSLTGGLNIANASGAGTTITIDDASTVTKGIASFNGTNFSVSGGAVNTIQNINSGATPTFSGVNTNSIIPSATLTVGDAAETLILQGDGGTLITATSGANTTTIGFTAPSADVTLNFPALSGGPYDICTSSGNCLGGGAGGANTALSNLTGVAINTTLLPGAAGAVNLGSATFPFGDIFLAGTSGTPGTNNFRITGASTSGTRTITLPNASGTVCIDTGNCAGSGGGVTTAGGTIGTLPVFTAGQIIGDSLVSQVPGTVTVNGHLSLSAGNQYQINGTQISSANLSNDANLAKLSPSQTFTGATNAFQNGANSTNAFNVQNAAGTRVLTVDTSNGEVELGLGSTLDGRLVFNNVSNANTVTIVPGTPSAPRTITLPDASGIICTDSGNCAGAGATLQTAYDFSVGGTTPKIKLDSTLNGLEVQDADTTIGADLFTVRESNGAGLGQVMFGVGNTGQITLQNGTNSPTAFRLLTDGGTSVLTGDTQNGRILLGQSGTLTGAMLFNNATNANQITLTSAAPASGPQTITLPDASGFVCLTSGNCAGVGGTGDILQNGNTFGVAMTIGTNDAFDLNLERQGATKVTVGANDVTLATDIDLLLQGATAYISNPQGSSGEAFGFDAVVEGTGVAVGRQASAGVQGDAFGSPVAFGYQATANNWGTAIGGQSSTTGNEGTAIGQSAIANSQGVALGASATTAGDTGSIAIGFEASTTASNQLVIGSTNFGINHAVIGNGVTNGTPIGFTLQGTSGFGSNVAGAGVTIAGGQGTGTGNGGDINLQIADPGSSGSSLNSLATVLQLSGTNGSALLQNTTDSNAAFRIKDQDGDNVMVVDTATSRIGLFLGGSNTPTIDATGLQIQGGIQLSGAGGSSSWFTPDGADIDSVLAIESRPVGGFLSVLSLGLTNTSSATARGILVADDRAGAHQPSIAVLSPNEIQIGGFSWEGSNTDFFIKNSEGTGSVIINLGGTDEFAVLSDRISAQGDFVPGTANTYTLGRIGQEFNQLFLGNDQGVTFGVSQSANLAYDGVTDNRMELTGANATLYVEDGLVLGAVGTTDTATHLCRNSTNQISLCDTAGTGAAFVQGGNSFGALATLGTNDANDLAIERNNVTQLTVGNGNVTLASNVDFLLQGATAYISNPQTQSQSEAFGLNATVGSSDALAVGYNAAASTAGAVAIGSGAVANGNAGSTAVGHQAAVGGWGHSVAVGSQSYAQDWSVAIGDGARIDDGTPLDGNGAQFGVAIGNATRSGSNAISIGYTTTADFNDSIAIGQGASTSAANQLVFGASGHAITQAVIGNGVTHASPVGFTLQGTSGSGTDVQGADVTIASGQGTGDATGGDIRFSISPPGTTGSSLNSLSQVFGISGATGGAIFQNAVNSSVAFQVQDSASASLLTANTRTRTGGVAGNLIKIGDSAGNDDTDTTILQLDSAAADPTTNLASLNGGMFYNSNTGKVSLIEGGQVKIICNTTDLGCGTGTVTLQTAYANGNVISTSGNDIDFTLNTSQSFTVATAAANTAGGVSFTSGNTSGTQTNGLLINRNGGGGTTTNGLNITQTAGTLTNGLAFTGTIGTDIQRASGTLSLNGASGITLGAGGSTIATVNTTNVTLATDVDLLLQGMTSYISNPRNGSQTEVFGLNASIVNAASNALSVGYGAYTGTGSTAIGSLASADTTAATAIGRGASVDGDSGAIAIGYNSSTGGSSSIALGIDATTTASNQLVIGASTTNNYINQVVIGSGVTSSTGQAFTLQGTTSTGNNGTGAGATIKAGDTSTGTCGTSCTGGTLTLQGGNATNGSGTRNGGAVVIDGGTGATANGAISIGTNNAAAITLGTTTSTSAITVGQSTASQTINIGNATTAAGNTLTVNIATSATSTGKAVVTIGNTNDGSSLDLRAGTGNLTLSTNSASASITAKSSTNGATAFRVLNASDVPQFVVDTSNSRVYVGNPTADSTGALLVLDTKDTSGDPTGVLGAMYYNSNRGKMRCFELDQGSTGYWRDCIVDSRTGVRIFSEMFSTQWDNNFAYDATGTGTAIGTIAAIAGRPGIVVHTINSSGDYSIAGANSTGDYSVLLGNSDTWRYETALRIPTLSTGGETFEVKAGFWGTWGSTTDANSCKFLYSNSINGGEWQGYCSSSSSPTTCDTNIAVSANTWCRLTVVVNSAGNSVDFQINGTSACQVTTTIPTGTAIGYGNQLYGTGGSTSRTLHTDYIELIAQLTPR